MISVFISFLYIAVTVFFPGFGIACLVRRYLGYSTERISGILMYGLSFAVVYAQAFSLFSGVGIAAHLILAGICMAVATAFLRELAAFFGGIRLRFSSWHYVGCLALLLIMSYGASRGYLHFDTGLYHAQSIRWIEEYGVVPGLGNLHCRLAYNSGAFPLTALYGFAFLLPQSLHTAAGFLATILAARGLEVCRVFRTGRVKISDFVRVALLFYLSVIYTEMMSPSSDYFAMLFLFYILLEWLELEEKQEKSVVPYSLLCVMVVVTVTIKLSAAIMVLLVLKPALQLIREKKYGQIVLFLSLGIGAAAPYLLRNILLSGWLVYPFPAIDLFSFDWKIPLGDVQYDAEEIRVYAKGIFDVTLKDTPMTEWLPGWFGQLKGLEKLWILSSGASVITGVIITLWYGLRRIREVYGFLFLEMVLIAGYLFWQLGTPLVRYGYLYMIAFPFFTAGFLFVRWAGGVPDKTAGYFHRGFCILLVLFLFYKGGNLLRDMARYAGEPYYLWQRDYETGAYETYEMDGEIIYVPLESGQIGYDKFPSSPYVLDDVELRGEGLREGFRRK